MKTSLVCSLKGLGFSAWLLATGAVLNVAAAASLQVTPISLDISPREQGQAVYLSNTGTSVLRAQIRVQQWTQAGGEDQLAATRDVVASPPLVEVAPGARQMVRIVRLQPAPAGQEKTYRLIIDELPSDEASPDTGTQATGLRFLLRYSVPVFILPAETATANAASVARADSLAPPAQGGLTDLSALSLRVQGGSQPLLQVENRGPRRIKLSQLFYVSPQGQRTALVAGLLGYVLAGQRMQWPLAIPPQALQSGGSLKARFNDDQDEQVLPLASDRS